MHWEHNTYNSPCAHKKPILEIKLAIKHFSFIDCDWDIFDRVPVQYEKSYLDLGFSICPTQPIFTNTERAILSRHFTTI